MWGNLSTKNVPIIGPYKEDFTIMVQLADTLLRLNLVEHEYHTSRISSYIKVCNFGQMMWANYRDKYEISD